MGNQFEQNREQKTTIRECLSSRGAVYGALNLMSPQAGMRRSGTIMDDCDATLAELDEIAELLRSYKPCLENYEPKEEQK